MKNAVALYVFLVFSITLWGQNTIGLPQVINFTNTSFRGGTQTWDIKQDKAGRMYFANNEGLLIYDGSYWKLYQQPNKSILRSIAIDANRIYAGGQDEIGYYTPGNQGILEYTSLKNLIPGHFNSFTDVWEVEIFKQSVFFRTWDRIFEYKNGVIKTYPAQYGWQFLKKTGDRLIAQDKKYGLFEFINNEWQPLSCSNVVTNFEITGILALKNDSLLISSLLDGLSIYSKGVLKKKITDADNSFINDHIYCIDQINPTEFVVGTTSEGCVVVDEAGRIIQRIGRSEGLQNNNVLSVFLDRDHNLWAGLDNGISFIAYNSAIKYIKPRKSDELSGYSARVFNNELYVATSDGAYFAPLSNSAKDISFAKSDFLKLNNSSGQVWRLDEINHELLMGHHNGSFLIRQHQAQKLTSDAGAWLFVPTSPVSPSKNILVGTYGGLVVLDYTNNKFVNAGELKGMNESLRFLTIDNDNTVWASHPYRGVYRITLAPDSRSFSFELFKEKDGLPSTFRNNVFKVKDRVVFGTEKGVYEFDAVKKRFIPSPLLFSIFGSTMIQHLYRGRRWQYMVLHR
jgi:ligand-binding sensor domain-containing protein